MFAPTTSTINAQSYGNFCSIYSKVPKRSLLGRAPCFACLWIWMVVLNLPAQTALVQILRNISIFSCRLVYGKVFVRRRQQLPVDLCLFHPFIHQINALLCVIVLGANLSVEQSSLRHVHSDYSLTTLAAYRRLTLRYSMTRRNLLSIIQRKYSGIILYFLISAAYF